MSNNIEDILIEIRNLKAEADTLSVQAENAVKNSRESRQRLFVSPDLDKVLQEIQNTSQKLTSRISYLEFRLTSWAKSAQLEEEGEKIRKYELRLASTEFPDTTELDKLRLWQHSLLRDYGKFSSLATLLALPSDKKAIDYFIEFGKELDMLSAKNCLVIGIGKGEPNKQPLAFDESGWRLTINEQILEGYSIRVADLFGIKYSEFPCLIVFKDIRLQDYTLISLKGLSKEGISQKMRAVFTTLKDAASVNKDPLVALDRSKTGEKISKIGEIAGGELPKFVGDVLITIIGAALKK